MAPPCVPDPYPITQDHRFAAVPPLHPFSRPVGLVMALPEEFRPLIRVMSGVQRERAGECNLVTGVLANQPIALAWAGMGTARAGMAADALLERGVGALVAAGFAGALAPGLRPGDAVAATVVLEPDHACWHADPVLLQSARIASEDSSGSTFQLHDGALLTTARIVVTAGEKQRLGKETGALAVDMESAPVARRAAAARVPMMALRVITDSVDESLPIDFHQCLGSDGQFHRARLIPQLVRRPQALGGLVRLGHQSARASRTLTVLLIRYIARISCR